MKYYISCLTLVLTLISNTAYSDVVVIGNRNITSVSNDTIVRIYTGRVIEVDGVSITPVNLNPKNQTRNQFLNVFLNQDEDKYSAYWTVRRFIGKGTPPIELKTDKEVLEFVEKKAGAIGYVDDQNIEIPPTVNILSK